MKTRPSIYHPTPPEFRRIEHYVYVRGMNYNWKLRVDGRSGVFEIHYYDGMFWHVKETGFKDLGSAIARACEIGFDTGQRVICD